jgi:hypothetical protein
VARFPARRRVPAVEMNSASELGWPNSSPVSEEIGPKRLRSGRMQRDVTRLAELGVTDDEHAAGDVKVAAIEADDFADAQTSDRKQPDKRPDRDGLQPRAQLVGRRHQGDNVRLGIQQRLGPSLAPIKQITRPVPHNRRLHIKADAALRISLARRSSRLSRSSAATR